MTAGLCEAGRGGSSLFDVFLEMHDEEEAAEEDYRMCGISD